MSVLATGMAFSQSSNIFVPSSSKAKAGRFAHTDYVKWTGPWNHHSVDEYDPETNPHGTIQPHAIAGFHPADIHAAYKIPMGRGSNAIAIIDAFHYPTALADFNFFANQFGLPTEPSSDPLANSNQVFQVVYASGSQPTVDTGWNGEEALDIEWAHAMAPNAKIYLVEATTNGFNDLFQGITVGANLPGVKQVSMSFGGGEGSTSQQFWDPAFQHAGVAYFASTGDTGSERSFPALSPFVVAVGGTSLFMSGSNVTNETAWADGGGGPSAFVPRPAYQSVVAGFVGSKRGAPDISAVADPGTGVAFYINGSWGVVGGTSVSCPVCAGIANSRGSFLASGTAELNRIYANYQTIRYRDITSGSNGFPAGGGYDFATGIGVPNGLYPTGGGGTTLNPISVNPFTGSYVDGDETSLASLDNNLYAISSQSFARLGQVSAAEVSFTIPPDPGGFALDTLGIKMTQDGVTGATTSVFLYNWQNARYELKASAPLKTAMTAAVCNFNAFSPYVDASGNVKVLVRAINPVRAPRGSAGGPVPFTFQLDLCQLIYTYKS